MKLASIEKVKSVTKHSNADSLEILGILGYQVIVRSGTFSVGQLCVFIQPDVVLPDAPWATIYKAKSNRTKAIRLRGLWSEGIAESLFILGKIPQDLDPITFQHEGYEVSGMLGITKYEPPLPQDLNAIGLLPLGIPKTDEERFNNLLEIPYGELCDVTLKIDGQSVSCYCHKSDEGVIKNGITGRTLEYNMDAVNNYARSINKTDAINKLSDFCKSNGKSLCLRGEQYGKGIQAFSSNPHSFKELNVAFFSVWIVDERRYARYGEELYAYNLCPKLGLPTCPVLEKDVIITPELLKKYSEELQTINGQPFEGVVIQWKGGSFKCLSKNYDSKK